MENFFKVLGFLLIVPIILTIVILIVITLIGGYVVAMIYYGWKLLIGILIILTLIAILIKIIRDLF